MSTKKRVAILISGRGSNMKALIEASKQENFPAEIALVISNRPNAPGLQYARESNIQPAIIDHKEYSSHEEFDEALDETLNMANIDIVCLAGFMRLLTDGFVDKWKDKLLNIHPSLLPSFKGLNVHDRVFQSGVTITGCTVHFVRAEMDSGPIITQAAVPVLPKDTADSIADRVLAAEHKIYSEALRLVASERVRVVHERVVNSEMLECEIQPQLGLFSPKLKEEI